MQRILRRYTGITASWLISRYRLLDTLDALQSDPRRDVAELAVVLGWYDQAHLTREFTAAVGVPPARYARALVNEIDG
ncbi:helix-turn-helix domain-containing protein [Rhodococcus spongiicola]|uniref:helix-turn-helix domain-containing protein n=1 Tax=Rhodococcus spongiicola TaxID=2487352 RepID=UPI0013E2DB88|nr:helix-turn-helix domain-containing protein [Rhodococcus spongiicola]